MRTTVRAALAAAGIRRSSVFATSAFGTNSPWHFDLRAGLARNLSYPRRGKMTQGGVRQASWREDRRCKSSTA